MTPTARPYPTLVRFLLLGLWLPACGGDGDATSDAGLGAGGSGGAGGPSGEALCTPPAGATVLLDWAVRDREAGSPVYHLTVDGDFLYLQMLDHIERVPVAGGAAQPVFANRAEIPVTTNAWVRADDQVLVADGQGLVLVPKSGGAATPLVLPDDAWLSSPAAIGNPYDRETNDLYATKFRTEGGQTLASYFKVDIDDAHQTFLATDVPVENPSAFDASAGSFYYQPNRDDPNLQATHDAGGQWSTVTVTAPAGTQAAFAAAHGGFLWFVVSNFEADFTGLAKVPVAGGELALVLDAFVAVTGAEKAEGYVALNDASSLHVVPVEGGSPTTIPLAIGNDCTAHAVAVGGGRVFSSFFRASTGESMVFSLPL